MKPILYPETETAFDSNGIGILNDAISVTVVQELNGIFELTLKYPDTGIHADAIADRCILLTKPDPVTDPQPFRIYRINPVSKGSITIYARHIAYDTMGIPCAPFTAASAAEAFVNLKSSAAVDCPFTFTTDKQTSARFVSAVPKSIWTLLGGSEGSILDTYGGEYEFDGFQIRLHSRRGTDRGVSIRYGKNLKTLEQDRNCAECYTGVYPYWVSSEDVLFQLPEKVVCAAGTFSYVRILPLDLSLEWETAPTEEQLRQRAKKYMADNDIGVPSVSWNVTFVQLEQTEEYTGTALLERVLLGDTVSVIFPRMNVSAAARAVKIEFDAILERYNSVTLGKVKSNLADTIAKQQQDIDNKPSRDWVQSISMLLTSRILGAQGGAVRLLDTDADGLPDTLYVADDPDPNRAVKVWRWNYEGWAGSKTGYAGPYIMGATLEDGLLANAVTTANLVAGTIKSADDGKTFFLDLTNGVLRLNATELSIAGKTVNTLITEEMTQQNVFNALTDNGKTQGIYLQDGKIYLNAEYIRTGFLEADAIKLNGLFEVRSDSSYNWLGGYIGYMTGSIGEIVPTDGVAMYNREKNCYFIVTDAGARMQAGDFSLYIVPDGKGPVVQGALSVNGDLSSDGSYVKLENWRYSSNSDSTETALESWLDGILANMKDFSSREILIECYPAITGETICARLYRHNASYAVLEGFSYNRKLYIKSKNNGTWKATESMAFS